MLLIVGLGNPGQKYENTRHNVGARVINELEPLNLKNVVLVKPATFMNESGRAVKALVKSYKLKAESLIVIHDDIDLSLGKIKVSFGSGSAGHKGVQSIIDSLGAKDFTRVRIGICPEAGKTKEVDKFVLQKFSKDEEETLKETIQTAIKKIEEIVKPFDTAQDK